MSEAISNPSPKARFQSSGSQVSNHRQLVDSQPFIQGADFAMLEYQRLLAMRSTDQYSAMATGLKLQGALEFLQQLRMLAEPEAKLEKSSLVPSLNHRV